VGGDGDWRLRAVAEAKVQGRAVIARLEGCGDRESAAALRGREVAVPRAALPRTRENEYYWADLVGLNVVNAEAQDLGRVTRILQTGANDVLVVQGGRERLIPFIAEVIRDVDLAAGVVRVDWGADY
ncbi:MAG: 16S rRNA processing protein RimM, partial [Betaproteobacteria bacterium]|nr:16S rRNA processing protein RimM [Betaproteobacteria bacterium]